MRIVNNYSISINQLADFSKGTEGKKRGIIKQRKKPNPIMFQWYQLAKSRIRKSLSNKGNLEPILKGIEELKSRKFESKKKKNDRDVSIEALHKFMDLKVSSFLKDLKYEVIQKPLIKSIYLNDVEVVISSDLIIRANIDGKNYLGAIKLHVSKGNPFDVNQQVYVATGLYEYLRSVVASESDLVLPGFCLSIDIFSGKIVTAPENISSKIQEMELICNEVKLLWNAA